MATQRRDDLGHNRIDWENSFAAHSFPSEHGIIPMSMERADRTTKLDRTDVSANGENTRLRVHAFNRN